MRSCARAGIDWNTIWHDYKRRSDSLSQKEQETLKDMKSVQEMYARGFEFMKIDVYRANAHEFQIIDGKLMPSLSTIDGLGDKAADAFVDSRGSRDRSFPKMISVSEASSVRQSSI